MPAPPARRKLRRLFKFSLASLLLTVTLVGVWLGARVNRARDQKEAVASVRELGGRVKYDYEPGLDELRRREKEADLARQAGRLRPVYVDKPWPPQSLIDRVGIDFFSQIVEVNLSQTMVSNDDLALLGLVPSLKTLRLQSAPLLTDEGLEHLQSVPNLTALYLGQNRYIITATGQESGLTNNSLRHVGQLKKLEILYLGNNPFDDDGLAHLKELTNLKSLDLGETDITGHGLKHLSRMTRLEHLGTGQDVRLNDDVLEALKSLKHVRNLPKFGPTTTDAGLAHLRGFTHVESLFLNDTRITDAGLATIGTMTSLDVIWLERTAISDAGLAHLQGLPRLWLISLSDTKVTDRGISYLSKLSNLVQLNLDGTRITESGVPQLATLPKLNTLHLERTKATLAVDKLFPKCKVLH